MNITVAVECISAFAVVDFLAQCVQVVLLAVERVHHSTVGAERTTLLAFYTVRNLKSIRVHLAGRKSAVTPLYYGRFRIFNAQRASLLA